MRPLGASSSVVLTGHPTASPGPRQGIAPSSFCREQNKGKRKEKQMAYCAKCGRMLGPGEGRKPATTSLFGSNGLVCDKCFDNQRGGVAGFFLLVIGLPIGAGLSFAFCAMIKPLIGVLGFGGGKAIVIVTAIISLIATFWLHKRKSGGGIGGFFKRAGLRIVEFFLVFFAIGLLIVIFVENGSMAKNVWGIEDEKPAAAVEQSTPQPEVSATQD